MDVHCDVQQASIVDVRWTSDQIRFSLTGMERYDAILAYLRAQNPVAADRMVVSVDHALRRLKHFPLSGLRVREFPYLPLRQPIVSSYRFFYTVNERNKGVVVVDVWHVAQVPDEPQLPAP